MTIIDEAEQRGFQKGFAQGKTIAKLWLQNVPIPKIAESVGLPVERVRELIVGLEK